MNQKLSLIFRLAEVRHCDFTYSQGIFAELCIFQFSNRDPPNKLCESPSLLLHKTGTNVIWTISEENSANHKQLRFPIFFIGGSTNCDFTYSQEVFAEL